MTGFRLEKWYFDCVSPEGDVLIGYAATLKWGVIGLAYGARITKAGDEPLRQKQSLRFGRVDEAAGSVAWSHRGLNVEGVWTGGDPIAPTVVVDESAGSIEWQCLSANAQVDVRVGGRSMSGTGYAEKLVMTVPPWKLPFRELRWGRYISDDRSDYMVWIDLLGEARRSWIWFGSGEAETGVVDDDGVRTDRAELTFGSSRPLRSDDVARTLLGRFRFAVGVLPRALWAVQEDKQLSGCVLTREGSQSRGWSINEVVRWR